MLKSYLIVFFISMLPLIELRGASRWASGWGCPSCRPIWSVWWAICCRCRSSICSPVSSHLGLPQAHHWPLLPFLHRQGRKRRSCAGSQGRARPRGSAAALRGHPAAGYRRMDGTLAASILDMKFKDVLIACMAACCWPGSSWVWQAQVFGSAERSVCGVRLVFHRKCARITTACLE